MKKVVKISVLISALVTGSMAMHLEKGWNLVSLGDKGSSNAKCILDQLNDKSLIFKYSATTKRWLAGSNNASQNDIIKGNPNIDNIDTINSTDGFWVYNSADKGVDINPYCNSSSSDTANNNSDNIQFTFGDTLNVSATDILTAGRTYFESDHDGFEKTYIAQNNLVENIWYEKDGDSWHSDDDGNVSVSIDNNGDILWTSISDGAEGVLHINSVKSILKVNDQDVSSLNLQLIDMNGTVTKGGDYDEWDPVDWQPTYWDDSLQKQVKITDMDTLIKNYTSTINNYWQRDDNVVYFYASTDDDYTKGDIVKAVYEGQRSDCNGSKDECSIYNRTDEVIGSWSIDNGVLTTVLPSETIQYKFDNNTLYRRDKENEGKQFKLQWLYSPNTNALEDAIKSFY